MATGKEIVKRRTVAPKSQRQQSGSVLVTVLVLAIVGVLVLMWQAGILSGTNGVDANPQPQSRSAASVDSDGAGIDQPTVSAPHDSPAANTRQGLSQPPSARALARAADGKDASSIRALADSLIAAHPVDLSACSLQAEANMALDCATAAQSNALAAVFEDYNARRAAGDLVANARGGQALKLVIAAQQEQLQPFADAAN